MKNQISSIYIKTERFAEITKSAIISGNLERAKKCMSVAERLFTTGNYETKNAISNVYIFSVSTFMEFRNFSISAVFPKQLKDEYLKQINATGV